jgi:hypothetical protein
MAGAIFFKNVGSAGCVVDGPPRMIELRSDGGKLDVVYRPAPQHGEPVLLEPGDQANASLTWMNWCGAGQPVTSVLVTLSDGSGPIEAAPSGTSGPIGPGISGLPRCDDPSASSSLGASAFEAVESRQPDVEPQPAIVEMRVPPTAVAGETLTFTVRLTNGSAGSVALNPCPGYTEDLIVDGRALKLLGEERFLLNCEAIGSELGPGEILVLDMRYAVPADVAPGPVELIWSMDPGGPFDSGLALDRESITIVTH